ncbi:MAG: transposase [Gammaproteobacteria bacterium]|nr:transposase [Gammaproteobacteria bacterium]
MRKTRHTESEIIRILKEVEAGRKVSEVCREYHIADAIYYNWKSK